MKKLILLIIILFCVTLTSCAKQMDDNIPSSDNGSVTITQSLEEVTSSLKATPELTPSISPTSTIALSAEKPTTVPTAEPINEPTTEPTSSQPSASSPEPTQVPLFLEATYTLDYLEIMDWFTLDKASILNLFGDDYSITTSLYQKETDLYSYENGLRFAFDADQKLSFLECADTVVLSDKHGNMSFKQLMYLNTPTNIMCFQSDGISYYVSKCITQHSQGTAHTSKLVISLQSGSIYFEGKTAL